MMSQMTLSEHVLVSFLREPNNLSLRLVLLSLSIIVTLVIVTTGTIIHRIQQGNVSAQYDSKRMMAFMKDLLVFISVSTVSFLFLLLCFRFVRSRLPVRRGGTQGYLRMRHTRSPMSRFHLSLMQREAFTANDYDMLQRLDEGVVDNQGASEGELRRLPIQRIEESDITSAHSASSSNSSDGKSCVICLSDFKLHDSVKSLPCLHRFHENCVDNWLRGKALCPICKFPAVNFRGTDDNI